MKIVTTTEVSLSLEDLEKLIREKGIVPEDLRLENVISVPSPKGLRLVFTKSTENKNIVNVEISDQDKEKFLDTPFLALDLSVRLLNSLKAQGIKTPRDLISYSESDFRTFRNFGKKGLNEVIELVAKHGVALAKE
jgi:hypothetical protein